MDTQYTALNRLTAIPNLAFSLLLSKNIREDINIKV